jgi:hypothetical protein
LRDSVGAISFRGAFHMTIDRISVRLCAISHGVVIIWCRETLPSLDQPILCNRFFLVYNLCKPDVQRLLRKSRVHRRATIEWRHYSQDWKKNKMRPLFSQSKLARIRDSGIFSPPPCIQPAESSWMSASI